MKNMPYNPFLIAGYNSPNYFCDREIETNKLISALKNGRNISLMSPRRYGKTGLIHHVFYKLLKNDKNNVCIYLDIFSTQKLSDFVKIFAESVLGKIDGSVEKTIKKITGVFKSFRPVISYDKMTGLPELSVKIENDTAEHSIREIFEYLKKSNKKCYIAIDEFQQITTYPEKGTEALLRSYIQFLPNVNFIFSGSQQHLMSQIFLSAQRPFYQSTQIFPLNVIVQNKYYLFAKKHFENNKFQIKKECFDFIYEQFEGHTWYIQAILNRLYEYRKDISDLSVVYNAITELLEENSYSYQELLKAYSIGQVNLLRSVAKEKIVEQINSGNFISKYGLKNASSVSRSIKKLLETELLYKSDKGYIVYDRFLGLWLEKK